MRRYTGSISVNDYKKAVEQLSELHKKILTTLYLKGPFTDSNEIAESLRYENYGAVNLHIGNVGKAIAKHLNLNVETLPKYRHTTGDRPSYYLLVHDVFEDGEWHLQNGLREAIAFTLPVNTIYKLPLFTVCKASGSNSPKQILLAADEFNYTVFSTERDGRIMTAQNKSVSKAVKVEIIERPEGTPKILMDCAYANAQCETLKERAIKRLLENNDLQPQGKMVLQALKDAINNSQNTRSEKNNLTLDEQEQEEVTKQISESKQLEKDLYNELINQAGQDNEAVIVNRKVYKRDNAVIALIKHLRGYKCQICGTTILKQDGTFYIEAAHVTAKHKGGKEALNNILILCPNHHKEFDLGKRENVRIEDSAIQFSLNGKEYNIRIMVD